MNGSDKIGTHESGRSPTKRRKKTPVEKIRFDDPDFLNQRWLTNRNRLAPDSEVVSWFDQGLKPPDPRPDKKARERLAREIQIVVNRADNQTQIEVAGGQVPVAELKDVSPADLQDRRLAAVRMAAHQLLASLNDLGELAVGYTWDGSSPITLDEAQSFATALAQHPDGYRARSQPKAPKNPKGGRPVAWWHDAGRQIATLIANALRQAGYGADGHRGRLKPTDKDSPIAIIGARAISWAYQINIESRGFAQALQPRNRSKYSVPSPALDQVLQRITKSSKS